MKMISPLDLILFRSKDPISGVIRMVEGIEYKELPPDREFSHVALVVTSDLLPSVPFLTPGRFYILESDWTYGYSPDVETGYGKFGVQIRDLIDVMKSYMYTYSIKNDPSVSNTTDAYLDNIQKGNKYILHPLEGNAVALLRLKSNPWNTNRNMCIRVMKDVYDTYGHRGFNLNPIDLLSSVFPTAKIYRNKGETIGGIFCSEIITIAYKSLGIIPASIDPRDLSPMDYLFLSDGVDPNMWKYLPQILRGKPIFLSLVNITIQYTSTI